MAERKITELPNGKIKFRQGVYLELSKDVYEQFNREAGPNISAFLTKLIEDNYNKDIVKVTIDEKIRNSYQNDIYKDYRIQMLLLNYYLNGSIEMMDVKSETSISLNDEIKENNDNVKINTISDNLNSIDHIYTSNEITDTLDTDNDKNNTTDNDIIEEFISIPEQSKSIVEERNEVISVEEVNLSDEKENDFGKNNTSVKTKSENNTAKVSDLGGSLDEIMPRNNKSIL
ncbi:hypothetical protein GKZ28_08690 [Clostridium chromiireducens]|jgi:hypothetical protein|uniref:Uncharacterized protein n=1 Tax=Clostridium chromiireducens TaxID=225345 RepID=A0A964W1S5_9CLOT|nr:hypothetical protein [Clostridium chromiireducens]MVX63771.1 hypothetical protein [Clostridium chromiireducens]